METSKVWVHLFLSHLFDSANPKNTLDFWSLMIGMRFLPASVSPILQKHRLALAAKQHIANWMAPEFLEVDKFTVTIIGDA